MEQIYNVVFNEWFWLPENVTWDDVKNSDDGLYRPQPSGLLYSFYFAVGFIILRMVFERCIAIPIGKRTVKEHVRKKPEDVKELEKYYLQTRKAPSNLTLEQISKQTDMTEKQITIWFKLRRKMDSATTLKKFVESLWRCTVYVALLLFGLYVLWDKSWLFDSTELWPEMRDQHVTNDLFLYYMLELGFYISLLSSLYSDVKRKDFYENVIHHLVTILLICMSWLLNGVRIGSLILVLHDASDPFLEFAKLSKYLNKMNYAVASLMVLVVVWIITRLILYPHRCIRSAIEHVLLRGHYSPAYDICIGLMIFLLILHFIWTYFIILTIKRLNCQPSRITDSRSSDEDED